MTRIGHLSLAALTVAAAVAVPLVAVTPAHADTAACLNYLEGQGYALTDNMELGCQAGADGQIQLCRHILRFEGVQIPDRRIACDLAAAP